MPALVFAALLAIFVVNTEQAEYIDYCHYHPKACTYHTFNTENYTQEQQSLVCVMQPLQYDDYERDFRNDKNLTEQQVSPTILNSTAVRCQLKDSQSGDIKLQTSDGQILDKTFIYPELCFRCGSVNYYCRVNYGPLSDELGCYIDSMCYPPGVVNPNDSTTMCTEGDSPEAEWFNILEDGSDHLKPNNICTIGVNKNLYDEEHKLKFKRVRTPRESNGEGLDLTHEGATHRSYANYGELLHNFKMYVKFNPERSGDTYTFYEIPSAVKMQHHQNGSLTVEYTFVDYFKNVYPRQVTLLQETERNDRHPSMRLTAMRGKSELFQELLRGRPSRNDKTESNDQAESIESKLSYWTMLSFGYHFNGVKSLVSLYINGTQVPIDVGDTTSIHLNFTKNYDGIVMYGVFSNIYISCMDYMEVYRPGFFTDTTFSECSKYYRGRDENALESYFSGCEDMYTPKAG